jgi:hypothetical protein
VYTLAFAVLQLQLGDPGRRFITYPVALHKVVREGHLLTSLSKAELPGEIGLDAFSR